MILTFYGKGKGKTSAALGLALRASGYGKKILFAQFIKGSWRTGEDCSLAKIKGLTHRKFGIGFVLPSDDAGKKLKHKKACRKGIAFVKSNAAGFDLVILDEILLAINYKFCNQEEILEIIRQYNKIDFILTGQPRIKKIIDASDLVSEIKKIKHPFDCGVKAKRGIDY